MTTETKLLPCPFCGGEPIIHESMFGGFTACCSEIKCCGLVCRYPTEAEAIEAWNTRSERTAKVEIYTDTVYGEARNVVLCGECGSFLSWDIEWEDLAPSYCPNCGCRVKEDTDANN